MQFIVYHVEIYLAILSIPSKEFEILSKFKFYYHIYRNKIKDFWSNECEDFVKIFIYQHSFAHWVLFEWRFIHLPSEFRLYKHVDNQCPRCFAQLFNWIKMFMRSFWDRFFVSFHVKSEIQILNWFIKYRRMNIWEQKYSFIIT